MRCLETFGSHMYWFSELPNLVVFNPFHWVFQEKEKRKGLCEDYVNFCSLNLMFLQLNNHFHQCTLCITMSSIGSRATTLCSAILPIVYTPTSTNLSTLLTGHCTSSRQCKISLLSGKFVLKQWQHLCTVGNFHSFVTLQCLPCISGWLKKNQKL